MYAFDLAAARRAAALKAATPRAARVPRVVYWIGLSSLLADISAETVASVLPIFLFSVLQLSPLQVGFVDGLYQGGAALVRVAAAHVADRRGSNRAVALLGYMLSVLSRVGLLLSGSVGLLAALLAMGADRVGKGIRTAPRDALIAGHTPAGGLGAAFGVHRSMDAVGALLGPLLAAGLLWAWPFQFHLLFAASIAFGLAGLAVFHTRVHDPAPAAPLDAPAEPGLALRPALRLLLGHRRFLGLVLLAVLLSAFTVSDGLLYLALQRGTGLDERLVPLMFAGTALVFFAAAAPLGRLADRLGAVPLFLLGYAVLAAVYLGMAFGPAPGALGTALVVGLLGVHYAATDGTLVATAVQLLDPRVRTTGLALLASAVGLTRIVASLLYGALWQQHGLPCATSVFAIGMAGCCGAAALMLTVARRP